MFRASDLFLDFAGANSRARAFLGINRQRQNTSTIPSPALAARLETSCSPTSWSLADLGYQRSEEFLGQAVHHALDQTRPKLRELSTNLGVYFIGQYGAISISLEMDTRTALGKARYPPEPSP